MKLIWTILNILNMFNIYIIYDESIYAEIDINKYVINYKGKKYQSVREFVELFTSNRDAYYNNIKFSCNNIIVPYIKLKNDLFDIGRKRIETIVQLMYGYITKNLLIDNNLDDLKYIKFPIIMDGRMVWKIEKRENKIKLLVGDLYLIEIIYKVFTNNYDLTKWVDMDIKPSTEKTPFLHLYDR